MLGLTRAVAGEVQVLEADEADYCVAGVSRQLQSAQLVVFNTYADICAVRSTPFCFATSCSHAWVRLGPKLCNSRLLEPD